MVNNKLIIGDRVRHNFSKIEGTLKEKGNFINSKYTHFVEWDNGKTDWYNPEVLEKIEDTEQAVDEILDGFTCEYKPDNGDEIDRCYRCGLLKDDIRHTIKQAINEQLIKARIDGGMAVWEKMKQTKPYAEQHSFRLMVDRNILMLQAELNQQESKG